MAFGETEAARLEKLLHCTHCDDSADVQVEARLDLRTCEKAGREVRVANNKGTLECEVLPANADGLPEGSFAGSCHGCRVSDGELHCSNCKDGSGMTHCTSLSNLDACAHIGNSNGELVCEAHKDEL